ncbi:Uncharacterized protein APZ42_033896, partial [Daphnia magna]
PLNLPTRNANRRKIKKKTSSALQPKKKSRSLYSTVIEPRRSSSVGSSKALEELEIYLNEPTLPMKEIRPLEFWRLNSHRFPVLSPIAKTYLVSVSSGSVERVFSTASDILSAKRNRMKPCLSLRDLVY